jgi:hypothetical protein
MLIMGAVAGSRGVPSLILTVALTRTVFKTGPGPDGGGPKPGPSEFVHSRDMSGTDAGLCLAVLAAPAAGAASCPKAGAAIAAANDADKKKFPRRIPMRISLHGCVGTKLRRLQFLVYAGVRRLQLVLHIGRSRMQDRPSLRVMRYCHPPLTVRRLSWGGAGF